jgi:hypothetical protein
VLVRRSQDGRQYGRMLTTQLVLGSLSGVDWARGRNIATVGLGLGLDRARNLLGATEGIPDDGHGWRLGRFVESSNIVRAEEMRARCGENVTVR